MNVWDVLILLAIFAVAGLGWRRLRRKGSSCHGAGGGCAGCSGCGGGRTGCAGCSGCAGARDCDRVSDRGGDQKPAEK